jgi:hypothetical protein
MKEPHETTVLFDRATRKANEEKSEFAYALGRRN